MAEIRIEGLRQFVAALRAVDAKFPAELRKNNLNVAKGIAGGARRSGESFVGANRIYAKSAESINATASAQSAYVRGGGGSTPYFWAAEYGGWRKTGWYSKEHSHSPRRQWLPWRGNQWGGWSGGPGYMINPTIRDHADELIAQYEAELDRLYREAFPE